MKRVGLITICDYRNYGNRLQNYAVQEVLLSLGCQAETIVNKPLVRESDSAYSIAKQLSKLKNMTIGDAFSKVVARIRSEMNKRSYSKYLAAKEYAFRRWTKQNIRETQLIVTPDNTPCDLADAYDYFIVGSDQVWNPIYRKGSAVDFLVFAPRHKRIAYAPSFGVSSIPDEYVEQYRQWLNEIESLSVREQAGASIIKELTGRDAIVLVDPTLMLTKEKWLSIARPAENKPKKGFLLMYFLGEMQRETMEYATIIASQNKLDVVKIASIQDKARYSTDPSQFIDYINTARILLTDSFHGVVFAILMEKPFVLFDRVEKTPSINSRIDTLLSTFRLESRKALEIMGNKSVLDIDYSHVPSILAIEREKALHYLRSSLHIEG